RARLVVPCFFFSSRRRHTGSLRDWSSDVCSSDLTFNVDNGSLNAPVAIEAGGRLNVLGGVVSFGTNVLVAAGGQFDVLTGTTLRSEERRVGKECRPWVRRYN